MISAPNTFQSRFNVFTESQPVRHVNVIGEWKVVELGHLLRVAVCQMLVGYSHVFVCVCVCMPPQLHAFIPTAMCILCRLVCVWVHVLELHIRFTKLPSLPGILPFSWSASRLSQHA